MEPVQSVELSTRPSSPTDTIASSVHSRFPNFEENAPDPENAVALPPVDRGKIAWLFLASAAIAEMLVWGIPFASGVLYVYFANVLFPEGTPGRSLITVSATLQSGLMYILVPPVAFLLARFPHERLYIQAAGLLVAAIGLFSLAFASKPWHLILFNGLLYPASVFYYVPAATLLFEHFAQKRGFAGAVLYAGTGAGGVIYPLLMNALLERFGFKAALISLSVGFLVLGLATLPFMKHRIPLPPRRSNALRQRRRVRKTFFKRSSFYAFSAVILFTSLGNFLPSLFIPSFAQDLGYSSGQGTMLVAVMNAASIPGLLLFGYVSDKLNIRWLVAVSCFSSTLACFFAWGFASTLSVLVVFVLAFGLFAMSFSALWTRIITLIAVEEDPNLPTFIFGLFAFLRGVGNVAVGPISEALLGSNNFRGAKFGYGVGSYGPLIIYVGACMFASTLASFCYKSSGRQL